MQIELDRDTEQILEAQAKASGHSLAEFTATLMSRYAQASAHPENASDQFEIKTHQDALIWILSRNPNLPRNTPQDIDWQQVKAEGRRY